MAKAKKVYKCRNCGHQESKMSGVCPECGNWNTMEEVEEYDISQSIQTGIGQFSPVATLDDLEPPQRLIDVESKNLIRISTGINEVDRALAGGIVEGSVSILCGEPGAGKSTIISQICNYLATTKKKVLYISGEESEVQVKGRCLRFGKLSENLYIKSTTCMDVAIHYIKELKPDFVVIDSIQYMYLKSKLPNSPGNDVQIMACANLLISMAKEKGSKMMVYMIGHLTKEGELRGTRTLEHAVDAVYKITGERNSALKIWLSLKSRFHSTEYSAILLHTDIGIIGIDNPSEYFMTERNSPVIGSALTVNMEGTRPIIAEIESLVNSASFGNAMRVSTGYSRDGLKMLLGILEIRGGLRLADQDVYLQVTGGLRISETAAELGILLSIASSCLNKPIDNKAVFIGEVGLTGELKKITNIEQRLSEADKMGLKTAYIPRRSLDKKIEYKNLKVFECRDISEVINKTLKYKE